MINTVTGAIAPEQLGRTLIHEHIICSSPDFQYAFPQWLPREKVVEAAVAKLRYIAEKHNVRTLVDGTPISLGRDIGLLKEVSERSGVQIIASSGFYFYPCFTAYCVAPQTMARFLTDEVKNSGNGISILKCAVDSEGVTRVVKNYLETVAIVHKETGLPIFMHSHSGNRTGLEALEILTGNGVDISKIAVGHVADCNTADYAIELLKKGCYVSVDRIWSGNVAERVEVLYELLAAGFGDRIMVSCDHICCPDNIMESTPAPGGNVNSLGVIYSELLPALVKKGAPQDIADQFTLRNAAGFLA